MSGLNEIGYLYVIRRMTKYPSRKPTKTRRGYRIRYRDIYGKIHTAETGFIGSLNEARVQKDHFMIKRGYRPVWIETQQFTSWRKTS